MPHPMFEVSDNKFSVDERRLLTGIGLVLALVAARYCFLVVNSGFFPCESEEISRTKSPWGHLEAVLVETGCGATTSSSYKISVVSSGESPDESEVFFQANELNAQDMTLRWLTPNRLKVSVAGGDIWLQKEKVQTRTNPVEIVY